MNGIKNWLFPDWTPVEVIIGSRMINTRDRTDIILNTYIIEKSDARKECRVNIENTECYRNDPKYKDALQAMLKCNKRYDHVE